MSNDKLFIPDKIHIGFQERAGTYTGKLAYVIYTDKQGKKRKEPSWDGWRDHKIEPVDIDNEPMSGFVLNKKVGGTSSGWNHRNTYVRVYDPREFEFEISVPNLLFILQETSAIKGKGLEGEFVYAWDRTDLVLLPVNSQEYKESSKFTSLQAEKVTKEDVKEGCMYLTKNNQEVMYLGRHKIHYPQPYYYEEMIRVDSRKKHVFSYKEKNYSGEIQTYYLFESGYTKLANRLSEDPSPLFPEEYEKFIKLHGEQKLSKLNATKKSLVKDLKHSWDQFNSGLFLKKNGKYYKIECERVYNSYYHKEKYTQDEIDNYVFVKVYDKPVILEDNKVLNHYNCFAYNDYRIREKMLKSDIQYLDTYELRVETTTGNLLNVGFY